MQSNIQKKRKSKLLFFIISFLLLTIFVTSLFLVYAVIIDIPFSKRLTKKINNEKILKLAEKMYDDGYLENSALQYRNYLETNPKKISKIKVYERVFEINIIRKQYNEALKYLSLWEEIDSKNPLIYILRIKLLFRLDAYQAIKGEIDKNYNRLKKSTEFKDLASTYYIKIDNYEKALTTLYEIPFNKREFFIHKKIIYCFIKLDKMRDAQSYIRKIDAKIRFFETKDNKIEFALLKAIVYLISEQNVFAYTELKNLSIESKYKALFKKIFLYSSIKLENTDEINTIIENSEDVDLDTEYYKIVGDYYYYKNEFQKALVSYKKIEERRNLTKNEVMSISDIYYNLKEYDKSIEYIKILNGDYKVDSPDLYKNLSTNYNKLGDTANELLFLKEGGSRYPLDLDFFVRLGKFYITSGDYTSALKVVSDAENIHRQNSKVIYDKRLDIVKLIAMENNNPNISELDFLKLRETNNTTSDYYFKAIEYYLKQKKMVDAFREIENVKALTLSNEQNELLNLYVLIYATLRDIKPLYDETKNIILKSHNETLSAKINLAIVHMLDEDFDIALDILNKINLQALDSKLKSKIFYLKAIIYYYKNDYPSSYKLLQSVIENEGDVKKVSFIKSLIEKNYKEITDR